MFDLLPLPVIPDGTPVWWYVTAMCLAVLLVGISKAGFGGGVGIVALPLVANVVPADRAVGVMLPLLIVADVFAVGTHFRKQSRRHMNWLLVGAMAGIVLGSAVLWELSERGTLTFWLNLLVGSLCLVFVVLQCYRMVGGAVPRIPPGPWGGRGTGLAAGLTSTLSHSAGPIVSIYLLEQRMAKAALVGTMVLFFMITNVAKLPTFVWLGLINPATLLEGLWFVPMIPVGVVIGIWMYKRIPERPFVVVMYVGAALAAGNMLWEAANG
ncbi:sulfite exporter TauE/SafE family protein [Phycisphaerales bacterium AB-hyl4]|uniref:Probable membrane transporter protein n=1 Tax=Natronomicrosphaera hydrolytica TaxID=3242702 RepID=A0ABV4U0K3_9BACT